MRMAVHGPRGESHETTEAIKQRDTVRAVSCCPRLLFNL